MKDAFIKLLKVKSLMTICVMIVFIVLALKGTMSEELVASVITAVITYYFTKNNSKEE